MVPEAHLEPVGSGLAPTSAGWFVVNAGDAAWVTNEHYGGVCIFESDEFVLRERPELTEYVKPGAGFTLRVVTPGQPIGLYHAESVDENFLVLAGECLLFIEGEERQLRAWDFVHCPPCTGHTFVATGEGPCIILAAGNRRDDLERISLRDEAALRHGASVEEDTTHPGRRGTWRVMRPPVWDALPWAGGS